MNPEPRSVIQMEKQLEWIHKLGGVKSLEISKVGQTVRQVDGISDMAPACWLCQDGCGFFNSIGVRLPFNSISDGSE